MNLEDVINDFLLTIEASGDVESEDTVRWNRRRMALFAQFVQEEQIADPLTARAFRRYAVYLKKRPRLDARAGSLSPHYRRGCLQVLKRFGTWLYTEAYIDRDLGQVISLPRLPDNPPKAITPADIKKMLGGCRSVRDRAILLVLRDTGCRASEIVGMRWRDVDLEHRRIVVTGKRNKSRWVFVSPGTAAEMATYRETVPHGDDDPVWWGFLGRRDARPLTYRGVYVLLRRIAIRVGVTGKWNPHAWRHAFGKAMNKAGMPTLSLQGLMGHSRPDVTAIYAGLDADELEEVYREFSPYQDEG